jgi:hypothetical protein
MKSADARKGQPSRRELRRLWWPKALLFSLSAITSLLSGAGALSAFAGTNVGMLLYSAKSLETARERLARGNSDLQGAFKQLRADADAALELKATSVMDKSRPAASGDKHDYFSYGPYWWPDPAKPDGLPYVRRDGESNPAAFENTDDRAFSRLGNAVETLGLAYWFTGEERYAQKAAWLVRIWFLDPATRMNPNFQYAQAIPGITVGRGIGIIEARRIMQVNEGLALLKGSSQWNEMDRVALRAWMEEFYRWLRTSKNGRDEAAEQNNHGSWYDAQTAHLALVLGHTAHARNILTEGLNKRIARQIEPDGSQPHELGRTRSLNYSLFNLEALFACARLAEHVGVDWWSFQTSDGRGLRAALADVAPYADPARPWPRKDIHPGDRKPLLPLLAEYLQHREDAGLAEILAVQSARSDADSRWRLLRKQGIAGAAKFESK